MVNLLLQQQFNNIIPYVKTCIILYDVVSFSERFFYELIVFNPYKVFHISHITYMLTGIFIESKSYKVASNQKKKKRVTK